MGETAYSEARFYTAYPEMSGQREKCGLRITEYSRIDMYGVLQYKHTRCFSAFAMRDCFYTKFGMIFSKVAVFYLFKVTLP